MTPQRPRRAIGSPIPHTGKHAFLESLHDLLRPATYLEIGVQFGNSLWLTRPDTSAVGIDPAPMCAPPPNAVIHAMTSGEFFATLPPCFAHRRGVAEMPVDLAFIDGSHLFEGALRDFMNVEAYSRPDRRTVAVFDDVLPYSAAIAGRVPLPGDWAGDVWKIVNALGSTRADLRLIPVDVDPTGVLVVLGLNPASTTLAAVYDHLHAIYAQEMDVPEHFLTRAQAASPADALNLIRSHLEAIA